MRLLALISAAVVGIGVIVFVRNRRKPPTVGLGLKD